MKDMRVLLTGGGTGGHIFPLLAVSQELRNLDNNVHFLYVSVNGSLSEKVEQIFLQENIQVRTITTGKFRRYFDLRNVIAPFEVLLGLIQSIHIIATYKPTVVFSKGGYGALPVVIAARIFKVPSVTHDSDAVAGLANKIISKCVDHVAIAYESAGEYFKKNQVQFTGNPVPKLDIQINKEALIKQFSLNPNMPLVVVVGGSIGSKTINENILALIPNLLEHANVIHQTGQAHFKTIEDKLSNINYQAYAGKYIIVPFVEPREMHKILAHSDLVVSRSGGNAISEIAKYHKPSILIPLSTAANNEQLHNALVLHKAGAAQVMEESELAPPLLLQKIISILDNPELRANMSNCVSAFYQENAARDIARLLYSLDLSKNAKGLGLF